MFHGNEECFVNNRTNLKCCIKARYRVYFTLFEYLKNITLKQRNFPLKEHSGMFHEVSLFLWCTKHLV